MQWVGWVKKDERPNEQGKSAAAHTHADRRTTVNDTKYGQIRKNARIFSEQQGSAKPTATKLAFEGGISKRRTILHARMVSHPRIQQSTSTIKEGKREKQNSPDQARRSAPQKQVILPHGAPELYKTCTWFAVVPKPSRQIHSASTTGSAALHAPAVRSSYISTLSAAHSNPDEEGRRVPKG